MITYRISHFGNFVVLFVAPLFFISWNNTDTCSFIFYLVTGDQVCFRRVWFCKPLIEAEFSDNIKGTSTPNVFPWYFIPAGLRYQPQVSFFGIIIPAGLLFQICDATYLPPLLFRT
jgi:hypothetical protein